MVTGTKKTERHGLEASVLSGSPTGTSKSGCEPAVGPEEHFGIVASELVAPRGDSGDGTNLLVGFSGWPDSVLRCGQKLNQRRETSSSDHVATTSGRFGRLREYLGCGSNRGRFVNATPVKLGQSSTGWNNLPDANSTSRTRQFAFYNRLQDSSVENCMYDQRCRCGCQSRRQFLSNRLEPRRRSHLTTCSGL